MQFDVVATEAAQVAREPLGGAAAIAGPVGIGADARNAEELRELANHAILLTRDERGFHGDDREEVDSGTWNIGAP